jgi:hypothetical protein
MVETARWLTPAAAADRLGVYPHDLAMLVRDGKIPAPSRRLGPKRPRYDSEVLDRAMAGESAKVQSYEDRFAAVAARIGQKATGTTRSGAPTSGRERGSRLVLPADGRQASPAD